MTKPNNLPFNLNEVEVEIGNGNVRVPERQNDPGSQANETADGLDAETEALRHATEDTPSGALPEDIEKTPVFDRGDAAETL
jgi:hypothetical protein